MTNQTTDTSAAEDHQARGWAGLTDSEVRQIAGSVPSMKQAVREAEELLRKKNSSGTTQT